MARSSDENREYMKAYYIANKHRWKRNRQQRDKINEMKKSRYHDDEAYRNEVKERMNRWRQANKERRRMTDIKRMYGLSKEQYHGMLELQSNCCAICWKPFGKTPFVDHCHKTMVVRGLLCSSCNFAVGMFSDDPATLTRAAKYLARANRMELEESNVA